MDFLDENKEYISNAINKIRDEKENPLEDILVNLDFVLKFQKIEITPKGI